MAQLRQITLPEQRYDVGPLKIAKASTEGAVLIELDGANLPDSTYENFDLATLEHRLAAAIEAEAVGELDGHEFGVTKMTVFLYGANAEELFRIIEPILLDYPLCEGARVVIRQAAHERRVVINGNAVDSGE